MLCYRFVSRSIMIGSICSCLWLFVLAWQLAVKIDPLSHPHLMVNKLIHVTPSSQGNFSWWKLANTKWSNIRVLCVYVFFSYIHAGYWSFVLNCSNQFAEIYEMQKRMFSQPWTRSACWSCCRSSDQLGMNTIWIYYFLIIGLLFISFHL